MTGEWVVVTKGSSSGFASDGGPGDINEGKGLGVNGSLEVGML